MALDEFINSIKDRIKENEKNTIDETHKVNIFLSSAEKKFYEIMGENTNSVQFNNFLKKNDLSKSQGEEIFNQIKNEIEKRILIKDSIVANRINYLVNIKKDTKNLKKTDLDSAQNDEFINNVKTINSNHNIDKENTNFIVLYRFPKEIISFYNYMVRNNITYNSDRKFLLDFINKNYSNENFIDDFTIKFNKCNSKNKISLENKDTNNKNIDIEYENDFFDKYKIIYLDKYCKEDIYFYISLIRRYMISEEDKKFLVNFIHKNYVSNSFIIKFAIEFNKYSLKNKIYLIEFVKKEDKDKTAYKNGNIVIDEFHKENILFYQSIVEENITKKHYRCSLFRFISDNYSNADFITDFIKEYNNASPLIKISLINKKDINILSNNKNKIEKFNISPCEFNDYLHNYTGGLFLEYWGDIKSNVKSIVNKSNLSNIDKKALLNFMHAKDNYIQDNPDYFVKCFNRVLYRKLRSNNLIEKDTVLPSPPKDSVFIKKRYKKFEKFSGIGVIKNKNNNLHFIFKSSDVNKALMKYFIDLYNDRHINKFLQEDWNKYGDTNFEFGIIEKVNKQNLDKRLKYYISNSDNILYNALKDNPEYIDIDFRAEIRKLGTTEFNDAIKFEKFSGIGVIKNNTDNISFLFKSLNVYNLLIKYYNDLEKGKHFNKFLQEDWKDKAKDFTFDIIEKANKNDLNKKLQTHLTNSTMDFYNERKNKSINKRDLSTEVDDIEFLDVTNTNNIKLRANNLIDKFQFSDWHIMRLKDFINSQSNIDSKPIKFIISFNNIFRLSLIRDNILKDNVIDDKYYVLWENILESFKNKQYKETINCCDKLSKYYKNKFKKIAFLYKGHSSLKLNELDDAILAYNQYLDLQPEDIEIKDTVEKLVDKNSINKLENYIHYPKDFAVNKNYKEIFINKIDSKDRNLFKNVKEIFWKYKLNKNNSKIEAYQDLEINYSELNIYYVLLSKHDNGSIKKISKILYNELPNLSMLIFVFNNQFSISLAHFKQVSKYNTTFVWTEEKLTKWIQLNKMSKLDANFIKSLNFINLDKTNFYTLYSHLLDNFILYDKGKINNFSSNFELIEKANKLYLSKNFKKALKYYDKILEIRNYTDAIIGGINCSYKISGGINSKYLDLIPNNLDAFYNVAYAFYKLKEYDFAIVYINKCLSIDSEDKKSLSLKKEIDNLIALKNIGVLINEAKKSFNSGNFEESVNICDEILELDKKEEIFILKIEALYALDKPEEAMKVYNSMKNFRK